MWSLYPHSVTRFGDSLLLIVCRHRCSIDSFQPYAVPIDHIGWCCSRGYVILWQDVIPVYCFRYSTPFSGGDPFYSSVTSLDDAVTRGDICTAESKSDSPLILEGFKQAAPKGSVIICQNLCRRAPLVEERLQLIDYTCRILSRKTLPDGKLSEAAVDHHQKMGPVTMGNIHRYPVPCLFNIQSPLRLVHGCRIERLTLFTFSDYSFHCGLRNPRGNLSHKIKCPPHTRMTALSVNNLDLVKPN